MDIFWTNEVHTIWCIIILTPSMKKHFGMIFTLVWKEGTSVDCMVENMSMLHTDKSVYVCIIQQNQLFEVYDSYILNFSLFSFFFLSCKRFIF